MNLLLTWLAIFVACPNCDGDQGANIRALTCPLWEIMYLDEGVIYYCDRYANAGCINPEPAYAFGIYSFPQICPNCTAYLEYRGASSGDESAAKAEPGRCCPGTPKDEPGTRPDGAAGTAKSFEGIDEPIDFDEGLRLRAPAKFWSKVRLIPELVYLKFEGEEFYAKVFELTIDVDGIQGKPSKTTERYIAVQVKGKPPGAYVEIPKDKITQLQADPCHAFSVKASADDKEIGILVLKAK
jgi:hypothetical protein